MSRELPGGTEKSRKMPEKAWENRKEREEPEKAGRSGTEPERAGDSRAASRRRLAAGLATGKAWQREEIWQSWPGGRGRRKAGGLARSGHRPSPAAASGAIAEKKGGR